MSRAPESDRDVSRAYRALGSEEPPAWLDTRIEAAARAAIVERSPVPRRSLAARWGVPFALAAVLVLSVSLVMVMRDQPGVLDMAERPGQHDADRAKSAAAMPPADERDAVRAPSGAEPIQGGAENVQIAPSSSAAARIDAPATPRAAPPRTEALPVPKPMSEDRPARADSESEPLPRAEERSVTPPEKVGQRAPQTQGHQEMSRDDTIPPSPGGGTPPAADARSAQRAAPRAPEPSAPAAANSPSSATMPRLMGRLPEAGSSAEQGLAKRRPADLSTPERWLEHIAELRKAGRDAEARASLVEFRKRYPDYPIPDALK